MVKYKSLVDRARVPGKDTYTLRVVSFKEGILSSLVLVCLIAKKQWLCTDVTKT